MAPILQEAMENSELKIKDFYRESDNSYSKYF